jgi:hypothetical protein
VFLRSEPLSLSSSGDECAITLGTRLRGFNSQSFMANTRFSLTFGFLVTLGLGPSIAISPREIPAEVKACKAIADDKGRLACFDRLFAEPVQPQTSPEGEQGHWAIDESKSPDGNPQVVAANLVETSCSFCDVRIKPPRSRFRHSTITLALNLSTFNCGSMTKIRSRKSGSRQ